MKARSLLVLATAVGLGVVLSQSASAALLFHDDFEKDNIKSEPAKWVQGFKGDTKGNVVADPLDAKNKVFQSSLNPSNDSRHDVGGSIYVCGEDSWTDYVAEMDMMFPDDFYMGLVFRFTEGEAFYLIDRRQGGNAVNYYKRQAGGWAGFKDGVIPNKPQVWYRAQLTLKGDTFTFKLKDRKDTTSFDKIAIFNEGKEATFKKGKLGAYGLIYLDNVFVGDAVGDLVLPVESLGKAATTWAELKGR